MPRIQSAKKDRQKYRHTGRQTDKQTDRNLKQNNATHIDCTHIDCTVCDVVSSVQVSQVLAASHKQWLLQYPPSALLPNLNPPPFSRKAEPRSNSESPANPMLDPSAEDNTTAAVTYVEAAAMTRRPALMHILCTELVSFGVSERKPQTLYKNRYDESQVCVS